jgi:phosphohistidine phosphatase
MAQRDGATPSPALQRGLRLTLVRHAQAEPLTAGVDDAERALDRKGHADAAEMARRCLDLRLAPHLLIASTALRTRQTADAFARVLELDPGLVQHEPRLYLARPGQLLAVLHEFGGTLPHVMLVGHNPGISDFAQALAPDAGLGDFDTAATCTLLLDAPAWIDAGACAVREVRYDTPRRRIGA